jgi:hypothetical protein
MSAQTVAEVPVLRVRPIPVAEPRPALRVVPRTAPVETHTDVDQGVLTLHAAPGSHPSDAGYACDEAEPAGGRIQPVSRPLPPATQWARQFVQAALEVAGGRRSPSQLLRWASEDVFSTLARRAALASRVEHTGTAATTRSARATTVAVRSVRVCRPSYAVVEATIVVTDRGRIRAVALRMEGVDGRWRVTALEIG